MSRSGVHGSSLAGFDDDRRFQEQLPAGTCESTAGELLGITNPGCLRRGIVADRRAKLVAETMVENREVKAACKAVQHGLHVRQRVMHLGHVAPHHDMRQAARRRKRLQVILRRLRVPLVAQWQRAVQKQVTRLRADFNQLGRRELFQRRARFGDALQVTCVIAPALTWLTVALTLAGAVIISPRLS